MYKPGQNNITKTVQQLQLESELNRIKREDNSGNQYRIFELNSRLETLTGQNISVQSPQSGGQFKYVNSPVPFLGNNDFIQNRVLYSNPATIVGIAAAIEQRGSSAGKIWAVVIYSAGQNSPDSMQVLYSTSNGLGWNIFVSGNIRPLDKITYDDVDLELVENNTGQKYLWVVFGYRKSGGSGEWKTGGFVLQVPSLNGTFFNELSWPGSDSTKRYYNIRITSDNARYAATPYLYLTCSFDSLDGSGIRVNTQKFARNLAPYQLNPVTFSYLGGKYYWYDNSGPAGYQRTLYTDIAYFNNGGTDSVEVSYCGVPDSTKLYFAKSDINGNAPVISAGENIGGSEPNDFKTHARLSSNGSSNGSLICAFNQYTSGNRYVKWFRSDNFGNFSGGYNESILWGSNTNTNYQPDIVGVRNGNTYYIAFETASASEDSVHYISASTSGATNHIQKMNYFTNISEPVGPKALFRYVSGDSCMVFYTEHSPLKFYSASGCSGEPIGIVNNRLANTFSLSQNYPNPFNPVTCITVKIAQTGYANLTVYDITGRVAAVLLNNNISAGEYKIDFDASLLSSGVYFYRLNADGFTDTKKMILVK
jgi:hypothetical protein